MDGVKSLTDTSVKFTARIYPNGSATTAYFQYGTTPSLGTQTDPKFLIRMVE